MSPTRGNPTTRRADGPARLDTSTILRVLFTVLLVAAALWILYALEGVLLLLVLAVFFAYLIAPLVDFVQRRLGIGRSGRAPAIGLVYLVSFSGLGLAGNVLLPLLANQLTQFAAQGPTYVNYARTTLQDWTRALNPARYPPVIREPLQNALSRTVETLGAYVSAGVTSALGVLTFLPWLVLIPILAFFLLKDASFFKASVLRLLPDERRRRVAMELLRDLDAALAAYIRAQLLACLLIGAICTIGFLAMGVPYALVLGLLAGLLEFIPLAGPLLVGLIAIVVASFHSWTQAIAVLAFLTVLRGLQDYVLYPRLIGRGIHMHPLAVILAILGGAELAGVAGIFLAIPVVAVLSVIARHWLAQRRADDEVESGRDLAT